MWARGTSPGGGTLGRAARAFRVAHALIALAELAGLGDVWFCALTRRRNRYLGVSTAAVAAGGLALIVARRPIDRREHPAR